MGSHRRTSDLKAHTRYPGVHMQTGRLKDQTYLQEDTLRNDRASNDEVSISGRHSRILPSQPTRKRGLSPFRFDELRTFAEGVFFLEHPRCEAKSIIPSQPRLMWQMQFS